MYTQIFWTFRSSKNVYYYYLHLVSGMENHTPSPPPPPPPRTLKMITYGTLPFENIAHDLFKDVVQWHSLEHPGNMRHSEKVKRFWSIGYKLFNERFVRYMGRYTNKGQYWLSGIVLNILRWGNIYSEHFLVSNGVKQGGILSPMLFNIYMNKCITK